MTHTLRNYLKEQGLVEAKISGGENSTDSSFYKVHPEIKHYKYGVVQPAVLCVDTEGKKLFAWAIDPRFVSDFYSFFSVLQSTAGQNPFQISLTVAHANM